ncbi:hypothetical protein GCM10009733_021200 [Nonomuraea maheshkhaliensis]|uniref:PLAT domain-containing protein n=1 Tax=Nonomuraea maheshkhaliensis TaxID=419590 RepID=A0ABP4QW83_9ACTN
MAMPYGWILTEDHCGGTYKDRMRLVGTPAEKIDLELRLKAGEGVQFRLFDSDGGLDYVGRIIVPPGEEGGELWFAPLDWAKRDTGSTEVRYLNADNGKWEVL